MTIMAIMCVYKVFTSVYWRLSCSSCGEGRDDCLVAVMHCPGVFGALLFCVMDNFCRVIYCLN